MTDETTAPIRDDSTPETRAAYARDMKKHRAEERRAREAEADEIIDPETGEITSPILEGKPERRVEELDGDESRRDAAVQPLGFRKWLNVQKRAGNPDKLEFIPYFGASGVTWPNRYHFEEWAEKVVEYYPEEAPEVTGYLIRAEAAWRAEQVTMGLTAKGYGIAPQTFANKLDYRTGQTDTKCGLVSTDGRKCGVEVVPGSTRCSAHGGALIDPETRRAVLLSTYVTLVTSAQVAVDTLVDVMKNSNNDLARVSASKEVLDRVGMTPDININVSITEGGDSPVDALKKKLDAMQDRLLHTPIETQATEATLVPDDAHDESDPPSALPPASDAL